MNFKNFLALVLFLSIFLTGCQAAQSATPAAAQESVPTVVGEAALMVDGKLVPQEFVNLSFNMSGMVVEVLVEEGQQVQAGQVLARLDQRQRLEAAVAAADLDLVNARQSLKALNENADVVTAAALQNLADSRDAVRDAERYLNNLKKGARTTDIDQASADVVLLKDRLDDAREDFAEYENKPEDNVTRARYLSSLADAQRKYDDAVRWLNNLSGPAADIDLAIAEANLLLAQARLTLAEQEYADVQAGPDPDDLEAAQARLAASESALAAAQAALADAELVAPFTGTLVKLDLKTGEMAVPGRLAAVLADFSSWKVETEDLNEMEIPQIQPGQQVTILPDALPELELTGTVDSISQLYEEKFGDITYTARIGLPAADPRLRWGMSVSVRFTP